MGDCCASVCPFKKRNLVAPMRGFRGRRVESWERNLIRTRRQKGARKRERGAGRRKEFLQSPAVSSLGPCIATRESRKTGRSGKKRRSIVHFPNHNTNFVAITHPMLPPPPPWMVMKTTMDHHHFLLLFRRGESRANSV